MLILSGISGAGKSFFAHTLRDTLGYTIAPSITTRQPRAGEDHCGDRRFCSASEFHYLSDSPDIIFRKQVYGNWYAFDLRNMPRERLIFQLKYYYINEFKSLYGPAFVVYVKPNNINTIKKILIDRNTANHTERAKRLAEINKELSWAEVADSIIDYTHENDYTPASASKLLQAIQTLLSQTTAK